MKELLDLRPDVPLERQMQNISMRRTEDPFAAEQRCGSVEIGVGNRMT